MIPITGIRKRFSSKTASGWMFITLLSLIIMVGIGEAASQAMTIDEVALYRGPDREQILIEGAKKEGKMVAYTSNPTIVSLLAEAFEKKYPFVKFESWRGNSRAILKKITEEYQVKRYLVDVVECTNPTIDLLVNRNIMREYYTPDVAHYGDLVGKGKKGFYYVGDRVVYMGLAFNTKLISMSEVPKTMDDLLDPKWKGKMAIAGGSLTWIRWTGNILETKGLDFLKKLSTQDIRVQRMSGTALSGLIVSGENPLSPSVMDSDVFRLKKKNAPVGWIPLEPVPGNTGYSGICINASHPYSALLFLDFLHSQKGQEAMMTGGASSPRDDMSGSAKFKKIYFDKIYGIEELARKLEEWEALAKRLFIEKR